MNLAQELGKVHQSVERATASRQEEDDMTAMAPEHFLDPIMSVLMRDPVTLPTSGVSLASSLWGPFRDTSLYLIITCNYNWL